MQLPGGETNGGIMDGLGLCSHAVGDYEKAISYFDKAIEITQHNWDVNFFIHWALSNFNLRDFTDAIKDLKEGLTIPGEENNS